MNRPCSHSTMEDSRAKCNSCGRPLKQSEVFFNMIDCADCQWHRIQKFISDGKKSIFDRS